jgi:hypothetical protein
MAGTHFSTLLRTLAPSLVFMALGCQEIAGPDASFPVVPRTGDVALLRTSRPLNMAALAARFATVPGVIRAEPNCCVGDGNDIRARPENGGWRLEYSVGFGDCPAGCTGRRVWSFAVDNTGAVRYLGASGDPLPSWLPR